DVVEVPLESTANDVSGLEGTMSVALYVLAAPGRPANAPSVVENTCDRLLPPLARVHHAVEVTELTVHATVIIGTERQPPRRSALRFVEVAAEDHRLRQGLQPAQQALEGVHLLPAITGPVRNVRVDHRHRPRGNIEGCGADQLRPAHRNRPRHLGQQRTTSDYVSVPLLSRICVAGVHLRYQTDVVKTPGQQVGSMERERHLLEEHHVEAMAVQRLADSL